MLLQKVVPSESLVIETAGTSEMSVLIHRQQVPLKCQYLSTDNAASHSRKWPY